MFKKLYLNSAPSFCLAVRITRRRYMTLFDQSSQRTERHTWTIPCPRERWNSRTPPCKQGVPKCTHRRVKKSVSELVDHTLYFAYFHTIMEYDIFWRVSVESKRIFQQQKSIIRFMSGSTYRNSCRTLFWKLEILTLDFSIYAVFDEFCLVQFRAFHI